MHIYPLSPHLYSHYRVRSRNSISFLVWGIGVGDGVVPRTVPVVRCNRDGGQLGIAHLDPERIGALVEFGLDTQAGAGGGRPDQLDDDLVADQRPPSPVCGDGADQPVLDLVPLAGPGW